MVYMIAVFAPAISSRQRGISWLNPCAATGRAQRAKHREKHGPRLRREPCRKQNSNASGSQGRRTTRALARIAEGFFGRSCGKTRTRFTGARWWFADGAHETVFRIMGVRDKPPRATRAARKLQHAAVEEPHQHPGAGKAEDRFVSAHSGRPTDDCLINDRPDQRDRLLIAYGMRDSGRCC